MSDTTVTPATPPPKAPVGLGAGAAIVARMLAREPPIHEANSTNFKHIGRTSKDPVTWLARKSIAYPFVVVNDTVDYFSGKTSGLGFIDKVNPFAHK